MNQKTRPYSSSSRATAAVSILTSAAAVAAACTTSSSSAAAQNSCCSKSPILHVTAGSGGSSRRLSTNNNQAAELLLLQKIPRGGSSTEKNVSSSSKSKESKADGNRSGGENKKRKKSKRGGGGGNSSKNNNKKNDTKQRQHGRWSKEAASASSETKGSSSTNTSSSSSSSSKQHKEHDAEESTTTTNKLPPAAQSILSQTCHYDVLGITKSATQTEIQKAYRRRCVLTHPDKTNGDRSAFDKVSEAYDILSCENKRALYDRFGMEGLENGMMDGNTDGGGGGGGFFGANDVFREFFGGGMGSAGTSNFFGAHFNQQGGRTSSSSSFGPRNRDLRYQLEVSLEDLYKGTTKHVAIQQPNPLRPHFPYRKEVEVTLSPGMHSGQSVRLSSVVDSIPDAAPADVVFLLKQRRHPIYTRRGSDLAMEVRITLAEAIVGYKKKIVTLDGSEIVIGNPYEVIHVKKEELVDAPSLPDILDGDSVVVVPADNTDTGNSSNSSKTNTTTSSSNGATSTTMKEEDFPVQQIVKTTTLSYHLPSKIIQTGDVHVLKGKGMPKRRVGGHDYGDLYIQYIVELPGGTAATSASSSFQSAKSKLDTKNLSPEERVELAKLLSKLEGKDDPTTDVMKVLDGNSSSKSEDTDRQGGKGDKSSFVHRLVVSSASEFGRSSSNDDGNDYDDADHHDEYLQDLHEEDVHNHHPRGHMHDFFQRAFHGGGRSFSGPFGFGTSSGGGFRYFSSSSGNRHGGPVYGEEDDHQVECNQM